MNKIGLVVLMSLALSACGANSIIPTRIEYRVVIPEDRYFNCNEVTLPDPDTLTNVQVASLINDLVAANRICANNSRAIREYLNEAKATLENRKQK